MKSLALALVVILLLSACSPPASNLPTVRIVISPAAQPVSEAISRCVPLDANMGFTIEMRYPNVSDSEEFDLSIHLGEPNAESGFSAQLAWEQILLIINQENQVDISSDNAAYLFSGRIQNWAELGGQDLPVELWAGPKGDEARQAFQSSVLLSPVSGNTHLATNPANALETVAKNTGAVAIMPAAWADETVRRIELGVEIPVIAEAAEEPTGAIRDLLACLQSPIGQAEISKKYTPFQQ